MKRSELAKVTNLSVSAILHYEHIGLLPEPDRSSNGYRDYSDYYILIIRFIKGAKQLGYTLPEIRDLFKMLSQQADPDFFRKEMDKKIDEINKQITSLNKMKADIEELKKRPNDVYVNYLSHFK